MNAYVGMAKAVPDSRMPRRLSSVMTRTTPTASSTRYGREGRHSGQEVRHAGGDRHRHGQHVVGEQRAADDEAEVAAEVGARDLVVTAAARVGVHVLPVRGDDRQHQHDDARGDPRREVDEGQSTQGEDKQNLLGRICDRGQRVAREYRERQLFRKYGLAETVAPDGPADHSTFEQASQDAHGGECYAAPCAMTCADAATVCACACRHPRLRPRRLDPRAQPGPPGPLRGGHRPGGRRLRQAR